MSNTTHQGSHTFSGAVTMTGGLTGNTSITGTLTTSGALTVSSGGLTVTAGAVNLPLSDYADDTAAAAGGVALGQLYHNAGAVRIRVV